MTINRNCFKFTKQLKNYSNICSFVLKYKYIKKGGCNHMQREITVREFENAVSIVDDIEPMIVKRENKKDLLVISLEQYQKDMFFSKLEKGKKEHKEGKVHSARSIFKGLRERYGY